MLHAQLKPAVLELREGKLGTLKLRRKRLWRNLTEMWRGCV